MVDYQEVTSDARYRAWATINLQALQSNFQLARTSCPHTRIAVVIKADGYGHGIVAVANTLNEVMDAEDCFAVATLQEAITISNINPDRQILLLEGFLNGNELKTIIEAGLNIVVHSREQLQCMESAITQDAVPRSITIWLKLDIGMHRLGFCAEEFTDAYARISCLPWVREIIYMSHLPRADKPDEEESSDLTRNQIQHLEKVVDSCASQGDKILSLAASAGILSLPQTHFQWIRPGIMLYGGTPFSGETGPQRKLQPVMTLRSRIIAIRTLAAGQTIGYGGSYLCEKTTRMAVVCIGYGDGYPQSAKNGTPVLVKSGEKITRTQLIGRVSMDMITIDLTNCEEAVVGDEVILWGEGLPADEVAMHANSLSYVLFCQLTRRVHFIYH